VLPVQAKQPAKRRASKKPPLENGETALTVAAASSRTSTASTRLTTRSDVSSSNLVSSAEECCAFTPDLFLLKISEVLQSNNNSILFSVAMDLPPSTIGMLDRTRASRYHTKELGCIQAQT
jgi:hypothetical protein